MVKLTVYPNPTTQNIHLSFGSNLQTKLPVSTEITKLNGQAIFSTKGSLMEIQHHLNTQVSRLPIGTYILKVLVGNQYYVQKLVKQ